MTDWLKCSSDKPPAEESRSDEPQGCDVVLVEQEQIPAGAQEIFGDNDRLLRGRGAERFYRVGQQLRQTERIDRKAQAAAVCVLGRRAVSLELRFPLPDGCPMILQSLAVRSLAGGRRLRRLLPDVEIAQRQRLQAFAEPSRNGGLFSSACRILRRRGQGDA